MKDSYICCLATGSFRHNLQFVQQWFCKAQFCDVAKGVDTSFQLIEGCESVWTMQTTVYIYAQARNYNLTP